MSKRKTVAKINKAGPVGRNKRPSNFKFRIALVSGPLNRKDWKRGESKVLEIASDQNLSALHRAILEAFGRKDPKPLYLFSFGKNHEKLEGRCYSEVTNNRPPHPMEPEPWIHDARSTPIRQLELESRQQFTYWFDFGDDWIHSVQVLEVPKNAD